MVKQKIDKKILCNKENIKNKNWQTNNPQTKHQKN